MTTSLIVRPVEARDARRWAELFAGYLAFYETPADETTVERAWRWVVGGEHGLLGLVAVDADDRPVAFATLRWFARLAEGSHGLYLDDLFTAPEARGRGAAGALLASASDLAARSGATVVRWITAADNTAARRLYDAHAVATRWVTYDMAPSAGAAGVVGRPVARAATA